jgi:hypothetical protein
MVLHRAEAELDLLAGRRGTTSRGRGCGRFGHRVQEYQVISANSTFVSLQSKPGASTVFQVRLFHLKPGEIILGFLPWPEFREQFLASLSPLVRQGKQGSVFVHDVD